MSYFRGFRGNSNFFCSLRIFELVTYQLAHPMNALLADSNRLLEYFNNGKCASYFKGAKFTFDLSVLNVFVQFIAYLDCTGKLKSDIPRSAFERLFLFDELLSFDFIRICWKCCPYFSASIKQQFASALVSHNYNVEDWLTEICGLVAEHSTHIYDILLQWSKVQESLNVDAGECCLSHLVACIHVLANKLGNGSHLELVNLLRIAIELSVELHSNILVIYWEDIWVVMNYVCADTNNVRQPSITNRRVFVQLLTFYTVYFYQHKSENLPSDSEESNNDIVETLYLSINAVLQDTQDFTSPLALYCLHAMWSKQFIYNSVT